MKPINFYRKGTPHHHKALTRWIKLNMSGLILAVIICVSIQLQQQRTIHQLACTKSSTEQQCQQIQSAVTGLQTKESLNLTLGEEGFPGAPKSSQKNFQAILKEVKNALVDTTAVEKIILAGSEIEIKISGHHTTEIAKFTDSLLSNKNLKSLNLVAIEQHNNELIATLLGTDTHTKT